MKYVLILGVVAIALVSFSVYFIFGSGSDSVVSEFSAQESGVETEGGSMAQEQSEFIEGLGTFADLQALRKDFECQVRYDLSAEESIEGTMFIADGKVRTDFLMESDELGDYAASAILLDDYVYSWSAIAGSSYGIKIAMADLQNTDEQLDSAVPVAFNEDISYTCTDWPQVDHSVFIPPGTVQFQEVSADMEYGTIYEEGELPF